MSRKQENVVIPVASVEQWDKVMDKPNLLVVDVYAKWAGPCESLQATFRRLKMEHSDKVDFVQALADDIPDLAKYRDTSVPQFLIYIRKILIGKVKGANAPLIEKIVKEKLEIEAKGEEQVPLAAGTSRVATAMSKKAPEDTSETSVLIIKPDAMLQSVIEQILDIVKWDRFQVLEQRKVWFTTEDARAFYQGNEENSDYENNVALLSSAPVMALFVSKDNGIASLKELAGNPNPAVAKEESPKSIRSRFGTDTLLNAVEVPENAESVAKLLQLLDKMTVLSIHEHKSISPEKAVLLVKPGIDPEPMIQRLVWHKFAVFKREEVILNRDQAMQIYESEKEKSYYEDAVEYISSGKSLALVIRGENLIEALKELVGPHDPLEARKTAPMSFRALYGESVVKNVVELAENQDLTALYIQVLFPGYATRRASVANDANRLSTTHASRIGSKFPSGIDLTNKSHGSDIETTLALIKPDAYSAGKKDEIQFYIKQYGFVIESQKELQFTKKQAEKFYAEHAEKSFFGELVEWMTSSPVYAMMLKREGAVKAWRDLMGPTDVEAAKATQPTSIRAMFGTDKTHNAVHGSDSVASAAREIAIVFSEQTLALIKPDAYGAGKKDDIINRIKDEGFEIVKEKEVQLTVEMAKEFYAEHEGKPFFNDLTEWMSSAPIYAMVLEKLDAIKSWRMLAGPTNSIKAREEAPNSIRALFGTDGSQNAVHGSDSVASAKREISIMFPSPKPPSKSRPGTTHSRSPSKNVLNQTGGSQSNLTKSPSKQALSDERKSTSQLAPAKSETKLSSSKSPSRSPSKQLLKESSPSRSGSKTSLAKGSTDVLKKKSTTNLASQSNLSKSPSKNLVKTESKPTVSKSPSKSGLANN